MNDLIQERLIARVVEEWQCLPAEMQPWGMWITRHEPLDENSHGLDRTTCRACQAWFHDADGVHPRSLAAYARYWVVHFEQPWCRRPLREPDGLVGATTYPIGLAAFAPYRGSRDIYLEMQFGCLFGRGYRLNRDGDLLQREKELWRSRVETALPH